MVNCISSATHRAVPLERSETHSGVGSHKSDIGPDSLCTMLSRVVWDAVHDPTHGNDACVSPTSDLTARTVTTDNCGIQLGIINVMLDYELQSRKLLILLTPVFTWCCSEEMNTSPVRQFPCHT